MLIICDRHILQMQNNKYVMLIMEGASFQQKSCLVLLNAT